MKMLQALFGKSFHPMYGFSAFAAGDLTLTIDAATVGTVRCVTVSRPDNRPATITENRSIAASGTATINIAASTAVIIENGTPTKGVAKLVPLATKEALTFITD
jgi:hypothetical protein